MKKTLKEIAEIVNGKISGAGDVTITGVAGLNEAGEGDITFVSNPKYEHLALATRASAIIIGESMKGRVGVPAVVCSDPYLAYTKIVSIVAAERQKHPSGISKNSSISDTARIGKNVSVADFSVVDENASVGDGTVIYPQCYIGRNVKVGSSCLIYSGVTLRENVVVGNNVIIHSGTVVGSDGFGYVPEGGRMRKIPQIGIVEISDDVEIGANVTIDRATTGKTFVGRGTKIDNLVQIAHNVQIGENSLVVAQAGISGSTVVGNRVTVAGQAGLVGHIKIGDGAVIAAQAGVIGDVPPGETVSGYPARPHGQAMKIYALMQRLPELFKEIKKLKKE